MDKRLDLPLSDTDVRSLHTGERVLLTGVIVTARDQAHRWLMDVIRRQAGEVTAQDAISLEALKQHLDGGVIYHCGPIVADAADGSQQVIAAGPTTSLRQEGYTSTVMEFFHIKGLIGKGGMGEHTMKACQNGPAVYFHAVGGAASLLAERVKKVLAVHKHEFGMPEALWVLYVEDFPAIVTMDAHGNNLHASIRAKSAANLQRLL